MRRHAEGLIILSGSTPGRGWRDPVPVVDVLRAAVAEVEDYVRVDVVSESRDLVAGNAVNDVIHLVAELVENATVFSPPNTRIEVRADRVGTGLVAEIEDRGLGLTQDGAGRHQPAARQPARVRPGQQRAAWPVRRQHAGRPAPDQGLASSVRLRGNDGHPPAAVRRDRPRRGGRVGSPPGQPARRAGYRRPRAGRPGERRLVIVPPGRGRRRARPQPPFGVTGRHRLASAATGRRARHRRGPAQRRRQPPAPRPPPRPPWEITRARAAAPRFRRLPPPGSRPGTSTPRPSPPGRCFTGPEARAPATVRPGRARTPPAPAPRPGRPQAAGTAHGGQPSRDADPGPAGQPGTAAAGWPAVTAGRPGSRGVRRRRSERQRRPAT